MLGVKRRTRRWVAIAVMGVAVLAAGLGMLVPSIAYADEGCEVEYTVSSEWPGGFTANVAITNLGAAVNGWDLAWTFPNGQRVTQAWGAVTTSSGDQVTATNESYNGSISSSGTVSFGFNGSWTGANEVPASFTLNGTVCDGGIAEPTTPPTGSVSAMDQVAAMQPGWNVGNTLDALGGETAWGNPLITEELLVHVKSQGFNSIRLPVTWDEFVGPAPDHAIDPARMERVAEVVDWALANDLQVLLNLHHDSWMWLNELPDDHDAVLAKYEALWTQIADRFKDYPPELSFESINEPQFTDNEGASGDAYVHELNTVFHEIVRGSGGGNDDRLLVLPTYYTEASQDRLDSLSATIDGLDDPMIAATVHFYGFWPFSVNIAGYTMFDAEVEADLIGTFERVHDTFVAEGVPVIVGEWAVLNYDHNRPGVHQSGELLKFFEAAEFHARDKGVTTMLWDAGQFLERGTLQWRDQHIYEYFASGVTTRSGTASFDSVYLPQAGDLEAASLTLHRNGLDFEGIWEGDTELAEGSDYTVSGDTLTFTAAALTRLAGDRDHGVNARLEARFSAGVPWRIAIITADTPVLSDATGPSDGFAIPTEFNGDTLSTMESRYADGTNAGPADWTPFQEFWTNFRPDYEAGELLLTPEFLDTLTEDEPVSLTVHFYSGATVDYTITKSGSTITGTTT